MREPNRKRLLIVSAAVTCLLIATSCRSPISVTPRHCVEKHEWRSYALVALEKQQIFQPDESDFPTRYTALADRIDYLEAFCVSVNEGFPR